MHQRASSATSDWAAKNLTKKERKGKGRRCSFNALQREAPSAASFSVVLTSQAQSCLLPLTSNGKKYTRKVGGCYTACLLAFGATLPVLRPAHPATDNGYVWHPRVLLILHPAACSSLRDATLGPLLGTTYSDYRALAGHSRQSGDSQTAATLWGCLLTSGKTLESHALAVDEGLYHGSVLPTADF